MSKVVVKHIEGVTFMGKAGSNHWIPMDGPEEFGGSDAATKPLELVLVGLAGCSGADVASLLKKMRVPVDKFEILVDADRAEVHPKVYTKIDMTYKFWGKNLQENVDKIEKAINLSQDRYCSVSAIIKMANIPLSHNYELIES